MLSALGTTGSPQTGADPPLLAPPASFVVNTTADSGPGSLRQAILDADALAPVGGTIDFDIPGGGIHTIVPLSPLPAISGSLLIDGWSQRGYSGIPLIQLEASGAGADGLTISGPDVTVRGLATDVFSISAATSMLLSATVAPRGLTSQLLLINSQGQVLSNSAGQVLVQSDGGPASAPGESIDEHIAAGTYSLVVDNTAGQGDLSLTTTLTPATVPYQPVNINFSGDFTYGAMAVGDFTGDNIPDLATPGGIYLGLGDGTFASQPSATLKLPKLPTGDAITAMVAGYFSDSGDLDLAVAYGDLSGNTCSPSGLYVLVGNGNGTFQAPVPYAAGVNPSAIFAGDFAGDHHCDLAVADKGNNLGIRVVSAFSSATAPGCLH